MVMKKKVLTIVLVIVFTLIVIILGNRSFAFETNGNNIWNVYLNNIKTVNVNGDAFVPYEPEQNVTPLCGLSTIFIILWIFSLLMMILGRPNTGHAGSSG